MSREPPDEELPVEEYTEYSPVYQELIMIAHFCGYGGRPSLDNIHDIARACLSLGEVGYGLALELLTMLLSGGRLPFHAVMPIPYNALGKIKGIWIFDTEALRSLGIRGGEGWFDTNKVYAWVVKYETLDGGEGHSCFIIRRLEFDEYPFSGMVCSPEDSKKLLKACEKIGKPGYTRKYGDGVSKGDRHSKKGHLSEDEEEEHVEYIEFYGGEDDVEDRDYEGD